MTHESIISVEEVTIWETGVVPMNKSFGVVLPVKLQARLVNKIKSTNLVMGTLSWMSLGVVSVSFWLSLAVLLGVFK